MIDLASLKEQLALLGHSLPDSQILSILQDMNIEVDTQELKGSATQPAAQPPTSSTYATLANAPLVLPPHLPTLLEEEDEVVTDLPAAKHPSLDNTLKAFASGTGSATGTWSSTTAWATHQAHAPLPSSMSDLTQPAPATMVTSAAASAPLTGTGAGSSQHTQHTTMSIRPDNTGRSSTALDVTAASYAAAGPASTVPSLGTGLWLGSQSTRGATSAAMPLLGRGTTGTLLPTTSTATLTHLTNSYNAGPTSIPSMSASALPAAPAGLPVEAYHTGLTATAAAAAAAATSQAEPAATGTAASVAPNSTVNAGTSAAYKGASASATVATAGTWAKGAASGLTYGARYGATDSNAAAGRQTEGSDDDDDDRVQDILGRYYGRCTSSSQSANVSTEPSLTLLGGRADATCVMGVTDRAVLSGAAPCSKLMGTKCDPGNERNHGLRCDAAGMRDQSHKASSGSDQPATQFTNEAVYMPRSHASQMAGPGRIQGTSLLHNAAGQSGAAGSRARNKFDWKDALRADGDDQWPASSMGMHNQTGSASQRHSSSGVSSRPSTASRATTSAAGSGGRRKTDVVSRYAQLQAGWQQDRFLSSMGGGNGSKTAAVHRNRSTAVASGRKPLNFHQYFKALHAAEAAEREMMSKMTRAYTADSLKQAPKQRR